MKRNPVTSLATFGVILALAGYPVIASIALIEGKW